MKLIWLIFVAVGNVYMATVVSQKLWASENVVMAIWVWTAALLVVLDKLEDLIEESHE